MYLLPDTGFAAVISWVAPSRALSFPANTLATRPSSSDAFALATHGHGALYFRRRHASKSDVPGAQQQERTAAHRHFSISHAHYSPSLPPPAMARARRRRIRCDCSIFIIFAMMRRADDAAKASRRSRRRHWPSARPTMTIQAYFFDYDDCCAQHRLMRLRGRCMPHGRNSRPKCPSPFHIVATAPTLADNNIK